MNDFTEEEDALLRKYIERQSHYISIKKKLETCHICDGLGFTGREELTNYHRGEYDIFYDACRDCDGDGRVMSIETKIEIKPYYHKTTIPFTKFGKDPYDNKNNVNKHFKLTIDERDYKLERDNPELEAISYTKYNNMVRKLKMVEKLKK